MIHFHFKKHSLIKKFLLSYLIILIIPLCIEVVVYKSAVDTMKTDAKKSNLTMIEQSQMILDKQFEEIDRIVRQVAMNTKIESLIYSFPDKDKDVWRIKEAQKILEPYIITNHFIENIFLYSKNHNVILTPYTVYNRLDMFYPYLFSYNDLSYEEFHIKVLDNYYSRSYLETVEFVENKRNANVMVFATSYPLGMPTNYKANMFVFVNEDKVKKLFESINLFQKGFLYILSEKNEIVTKIGGFDESLSIINEGDLNGSGYLEMDINHEKMLISYTQSKYNGWKYVVAIPYNQVMVKVNRIILNSVIVTSLFMLIGFSIAFWLARRNARPVLDIVTRINDSFGDKESDELDEYEYVSHSINKLLCSEDEMKKAIEAHGPLLHVAFFGNLLGGKYLEEKDIEAALIQADISWEPNKIVVLTFKMETKNKNNNKKQIYALNENKIIIKEAFRNKVDSDVYFYDTDIDKMVMFFDFNDKLILFLNKELNILENKFNIYFDCGGAIANDWMAIPRAYQEALKALEYATLHHNSKIKFYDSQLEDSQSYFYPMDMETRFIQYIRSANDLEVLQTIHFLYEENINKRLLSSDMIWQLLYEIKGTMTKVMSNIHIANYQTREIIKKEIDNLFESSSIELIFESFEEILILMCEDLKKQKNSHNDILKDDMLRFTHENYNDQTFGLAMLAEYFNLNESYVSQFFKEQVGCKFFQYLESYRLTKAKELIKTTDLSIKIIANKVGYNSAHSFRRAFKKIYGVLPASCRFD